MNIPRARFTNSLEDNDWAIGTNSAARACLNAGDWVTGIFNNPGRSRGNTRLPPAQFRNCWDDIIQVASQVLNDG